MNEKLSVFSTAFSEARKKPMSIPLDRAAYPLLLAAIPDWLLQDSAEGFKLLGHSAGCAHLTI